VTTYLEVVKVAKISFLEIYHKLEQTQQQDRQETRRKMPLGYLILVVNDVKQRLLKILKTHNQLKAKTLIGIKRRMFKSLIA
jgi:hypothetical protein